MSWIVANHKREGGGSVSIAGKTHRSMDGTTIELPRHPLSCRVIHADADGAEANA